MAFDVDSDDRTEQPTARRRQELRQRGEVARSSDRTIAVMLLAATAGLNFFGKDLTISLAEALKKSLSTPAWTSLDLQSASGHLIGLTAFAARGMLPILGFVLLA